MAIDPNAPCPTTPLHGMKFPVMAVSADIDGTPVSDTAASFTLRGNVTEAGFQIIGSTDPRINVALYFGCRPGTYTETSHNAIQLGVVEALGTAIPPSWACRDLTIPSSTPTTGCTATLTLESYGVNSGDVIKGTFSGTLVSTNGGADTVTVSNGKFEMRVP